MVGKESVIIANRQVPVTQKQKTTDHIDEELHVRFEIFKTSPIIFPCYFRILKRVSRISGEESVVALLINFQFSWSLLVTF